MNLLGAITLYKLYLQGITKLTETRVKEIEEILGEEIKTNLQNQYKKQQPEEIGEEDDE